MLLRNKFYKRSTRSIDSVWSVSKSQEAYFWRNQHASLKMDIHENKNIPQNNEEELQYPILKVTIKLQ